jgi:lipopolysaccharide export system permease protein
LRTLLILGMSFVLLTVLVGDYVAPAADNFSQKLRVISKGQISRAPPAPGSRKSRAITL